MSEEYTQAEMVRTLTRLEEGQTKLEHKIDALSATYVQKDAYEIRTSAIERDIKAIKQTHTDDITTIRAEQAPVKTSPWVIASVIISALVGAGSVITVFVMLTEAIGSLH